MTGKIDPTSVVITDANVLAYVEQIEQENDELLEEVGRLRVQLAGCSVAASGYAEKPPLDPSAYGWSVAYQDVANLYERYEKLLEENRFLKILDEQSSHLVSKYKEQADEIDRKYTLLSRGWIPVTDRLPESYRCVLAASDKREVTEAFFVSCGDEDMWSTFSDDFSGTVTHWMQLPEPPEEE